MDIDFKFDFWTVFGFIGSAFYFGRIVVQWIMSERAKKPVIPAAYWHLSILGALILATYSLARKDPVFLLNYIVPLAIYIRQTVLHYRNAKPSPINAAESSQENPE